MDEIKISYADKRVKQIITDCYPTYKGRKVRLSTYMPKQIDSYWDEGSRDYFVWYQPTTRKSFPVHSNHPGFERNQPRNINPELIPEDVMLVEHSIFCGKDVGITIHINPEQKNLLE